MRLHLIVTTVLTIDRANQLDLCPPPGHHIKHHLGRSVLYVHSIPGQHSPGAGTIVGQLQSQRRTPSSIDEAQYYGRVANELYGGLVHPVHQIQRCSVRTMVTRVVLDVRVNAAASFLAQLIQRVLPEQVEGRLRLIA